MMLKSTLLHIYVLVMWVIPCEIDHEWDCYAFNYKQIPTLQERNEGQNGLKKTN